MNSSPTPADAVGLLQKLIRCASVTPAEAGVLDVVEQALAPLGFAVTRLRFEGNGSYPVDNLFATRGSTGPHLLFNGHTDVVPPGDRDLWSHEPFGAEIVDGTLYGRGAADMKSGVAAFIAALANAPAEARISLAITNDEEADGVNGTARLMKWAAGEGHRFDFAIVGEPSATARVGDSIKIGRRGSFSGEIEVTGVQGHVAYPHKALNPIPVAGSIAAALSGPLDAGTAHFPPSNLEFTSIDTGNPVGNVIPAIVRMRFNVRFNEQWAPESLTEALRQKLANLESHGAQVVLTALPHASRSFLSPTSGAVALLAEAIAATCGAPPEFSTAGGTSDARFIADHCPVVECGLPGPSMHKADECVAVADVEALRALYAAFLRRFFMPEG